MCDRSRSQSFHPGPAPHTQASEASTRVTGSSCLSTSIHVGKKIDLSPRRPLSSCRGPLWGLPGDCQGSDELFGQAAIWGCHWACSGHVGASGCGTAGQGVMPPLAFRASGLSRALGQSGHRQTPALALTPGSIHLTRPPHGCQDRLPLGEPGLGEGRRAREKTYPKAHTFTHRKGSELVQSQGGSGKVLEKVFAGALSWVCLWLLWSCLEWEVLPGYF